MKKKANLAVQLLANDVLIEESEDPVLWRQVLQAIQDGNPTIGLPKNGSSVGDSEKPLGGETKDNESGCAALASALGVNRDQLTGSCDPSSDAPFLHLDHKFWQKFKENTPKRGPKAAAGVQLAGTLLCLWFKYSGIEGNPTQTQAQEVLKSIGVEDKNPSRSIKNCEWLQGRNNGYNQINAARWSKAVAVAKAYVTQQHIEDD